MGYEIMIKNLCSLLAVALFAIWFMLAIIIMAGGAAAGEYEKELKEIEECGGQYFFNKCTKKNLGILALGVIGTIGLIATSQPGCNQCPPRLPQPSFAFGTYINQKYDGLTIKYTLNF